MHFLVLSYYLGGVGNDAAVQGLPLQTLSAPPTGIVVRLRPRPAAFYSGNSCQAGHHGQSGRASQANSAHNILRFFPMGAMMGRIGCDLLVGELGEMGWGNGA